MSEFYLGNGSKRPKESDYRKKWGWQGGLMYICDKLKYEQKQQALKQFKQNQKKASEYAKKMWG